MGAEEDKELEGGNQQSEEIAGETTWLCKEPASKHTDFQRSRRMREIQAKATHNTIRDDCSVFGEHVANKIRKLSNPRAQAMVQHLICNTLFDAEMGKFDSPRMYGQPHCQQYPLQHDADRFRRSTGTYEKPASTSTGRPCRQINQLASPTSPLVSHSPSEAESNNSEVTSEDIDRILHSFQ
ncbi:hypothetical protein J6590_060112 [Homalodisca vitripennis]|nr:hypothetical protein J6590_060112 [Homalodisca vitripennis]